MPKAKTFKPTTGHSASTSSSHSLSKTGKTSTSSSCAVVLDLDPWRFSEHLLPPRGIPSDIVVGVIGKAGSGKDTVADHLVRDLGFTKMALADPIRRIVETVFFVDFSAYNTDREMRDRPLPDYPNWTVRKLQQIIGTEFFRVNVDEDVWIKNLCVRISKCRTPVVVADVRFPNERDKLKDMLRKIGRKMVFVKLTRPGCEGKVGVANHASEAYDLPGDIQVVNGEAIPQLEAEVDKALQKWLGKRRRY